MKKTAVKDILIFAAIIAFLIFHILKLNGYMDFSGNYGIKYLGASREILNLQLMLDKETLTEWGALENAYAGDYLEIAFRKERPIERVCLDCGSKTDLKLLSQDPASGGFKLVGTILSQDGDKVLLCPEEKLMASRIRIQVAEGIEDVPWTVREIQII
jgi:hypothetical protein